MMNTEILELDNGKYTLYMTSAGTLTAHRFGEPWRDMTGDNVVYSMFAKIKELEQQVEVLTHGRKTNL